MNFLKLTYLFAFGIFLISSVSATIISGGLWSNNNQSISITNGQSANFSAYFGTIPWNFMTINIKLYDANYNLIYAFENNKAVNSNTFSNKYSVTPSIYQNPGNYHLVIFGTDQDGSNTYSLNLIVNPASPPVDSIPVISSSPLISINEGTSYYYQLIASDADGDTLTYSLLQNPAWISINPSTGVVSGMAPLVNANTGYTISIDVSDGVNIVAQTYSLTVVDTTLPITDTTPPAISYNPTTELNNSYLNRNYALINISASDSHLASVILNWNGINTTFTNNSGNNYWVNGTGLVDGNYTFYSWANDTFGNSNQTQTYTILIDATAPQIQFAVQPPEIILFLIQRQFQ